MGMFDHFPYTNFHELNLDWIISAVKELLIEVDSLDSWKEEHETGAGLPPERMNQYCPDLVSPVS